MQLNKQVFKLHQFFTSLNNTKLVLIFVFINLVLSLLFSLLANVISAKNLTDGFPQFGSIKKEIFLGVILAPLFETLVFQFGIIETVKKRLSPILSCLVSALFFGATHLYNIQYFFFTFLVGVFLAWLYFIGGTKLRGFLLVLISHMIHNFLAFTFSHI